MEVETVSLGMRPQRMVQPRVMGLEVSRKPRIEPLCQHGFVKAVASFEILHFSKRQTSIELQSLNA